MADNTDEDDCFADMGFMFEGAEESTQKTYEWRNGSKTVRIALRIVDNDPGAVQSGHYLWPAAPALAQYMLHEMNDSINPKSVVELGAGCALASIAALQIFESVETIVTTDHDPGTLVRAENNHDLTLELFEDDEDFLNRVMRTQSLWEPLSWGDTKSAEGIISKTDGKFDLVLGSDLIYDKEVVRPLFITAVYLMKEEEGGVFVMTQSFVYDEETEQEIDSICAEKGIDRKVVVDKLAEGGVKIQQFTRH